MTLTSIEQSQVEPQFTDAPLDTGDLSPNSDINPGGAEAFTGEELFSELGKLYRILRHRGVEPHEAEDIEQDTALKMLQHKEALRGRELRLGAYVMTAGMNRRKDCLRRKTVKTVDEYGEEKFITRLSPLNETVTETAVSSEGDPEDQIISNDVVQRVLNELPEDFRRAVLLIDVMGYSYDEAAAALRVPVGTIRSRVSRGRARIREIYPNRASVYAE